MRQFGSDGSPAGAAALTEFLIKAQVAAFLHFGDVDDLSVVQTKVLNHLVNRRQPADCVALDLPGLEQFFSRHPSEDFSRFVKRLSKTVEKIAGREVARRIELRRSISTVFEPVKRCHQPLPDVPIQMQNKVANAVAGLIGAPPYLLVAERFNRFAQSRPVLLEQFAAENSRKSSHAGSAGMTACTSLDNFKFYRIRPKQRRRSGPWSNGGNFGGILPEDL